MSGFESHRHETFLELWQTWCMRRTENPENVVRLHEVPPEDGLSELLLLQIGALSVGAYYRIALSVFSKCGG